MGLFNLFNVNSVSPQEKYEYDLFERGELEERRNPKIKCPLCKKITIFNSFDLHHTNSLGYIDGYYARLLRCSECHIIIAEKDKEEENV